MVVVVMVGSHEKHGTFCVCALCWQVCVCVCVLAVFVNTVQREREGERERERERERGKRINKKYVQRINICLFGWGIEEDEEEEGRRRRV